MREHITIEIGEIEQAVIGLRRLTEPLWAPSWLNRFSDLSAFSMVSGFRNVGLRLGRISDFYSVEALDALSNHLLDVAGVVEANLANVVGADDSLAGVFARLGSVVAVGGPGPEYASRMGEVAAEAKAVNATASDFTPPSPMVGTQRDLSRLHHKLTGSNIAATAEDAAYWRALAARVTETVEALYGVKAALASSMDTQWVRRGDERLNRIQRAGGMYAAHAEAMAGHVEALGTTAAAEQVMAASAVATAAATADPVERKAFEQQYLEAFPQRATASLATTVPEFTKLLPDLSHVSGARYAPAEVASPQVPVFAHSPLPGGVRDALVANGYGDVAHARTPAEVVGQFGRVNPDGLAAIAAGATPTQVASAAAPAMPPTLTPGTTSTPLATTAPAGVGGGVPAGVVLPAGGATSATGRAGSTKLNLTPTTPGAPGVGVGGRHATTARGNTGGDTTGGVVGSPRAAARPGAGGARGGSTLYTPHDPTTAHGGRGGNSAPGTQAGGPGAHPRGGVGTTTGLGGGLSGAHGATNTPGGGRSGSGGGLSASTPLGATVANPGGTAGGTNSNLGNTGTGAGGSGSGVGGSGSGAHGGYGSGAGSNAHGAGVTGGGAGVGQQQRSVAFGGAPMGVGGAGGRGPDEKKPGKVKAVTSAVEREGNLRALLGEAPLVLPPVIGHNVRD